MLLCILLIHPLIYRFTLSSLFDHWCISCRHWADFFLVLMNADNEVTEEELIAAVESFGKDLFF